MVLEIRPDGGRPHDDGAPDEDLVRRVLAGDLEASRTLFRRHEALLRSSAARRLGRGLQRKVGASDVVQESYLTAFLKLEDFEDRGPGSFRRWLERIVERKVSDEVKRHVRSRKRSARREESFAATAGAPEPSGRGPGPATQVAHNDANAALRAAIERMDGDDRTILELVHSRGLDFAAAGREMGRSAEAARKLYGRVVMRLSREVRRGR